MNFRSNQILPTGAKIGSCLVVQSDFNELNEYVLNIEQTKEVKKKGLFKRLGKLEVVSTVAVELKTPIYYSANSNGNSDIIHAAFSNPADVYQVSKSLTLQIEDSKKGPKITQLTIQTDKGVTINCI